MTHYFSTPLKSCCGIELKMEHWTNPPPEKPSKYNFDFFHNNICKMCSKLQCEHQIKEHENSQH